MSSRHHLRDLFCLVVELGLEFTIPLLYPFDCVLTHAINLIFLVVVGCFIRLCRLDSNSFAWAVLLLHSLQFISLAKEDLRY